MRKEKTKELLKCDLTEDEIKEAGFLLAKATAEIKSLEDDLKSVKSDFKARIDSAQAGANRQANLIQNGYDYRQVDCELQYLPGGYVHTIRLDTLEVVRSRPMTADERQEHLFEMPDKEMPDEAKTIEPVTE